jgi:hypothetical protein
MGAIGTAATGGGALLPWLHLRSEGKWLRWLRLNPPKLAPFLAAPNIQSLFRTIQAHRAISATTATTTTSIIEAGPGSADCSRRRTAECSADRASHRCTPPGVRRPPCIAGRSLAEPRSREPRIGCVYFLQRHWRTWDIGRVRNLWLIGLPPRIEHGITSAMSLLRLGLLPDCVHL